MGGYIGSNIGTIANAAERKQTYSITTATTSLTGLAYTPTKVHVFHNGVRLVDGTDYTATNGTSITLTNAAQNGDEVVVISYPSFQTSDTVSAANGGTFAGNVTFSGTTTGLDVNGTELVLDADGDTSITADTDDRIDIKVGGADAAHIKDTAAHGTGLGIGIDTPLRQLHISNTSANSEIAFTAGTSGVSSLLFGDGQTGTDVYRGYLQYNHSDDAMLFATAATERVRIESDGRFKITTMPVGGTANLHYSSAGGGQFFVTSSSRRFKHDIVDYDKGLAEVLQMQPKYFVYNEEPNEKQRAGFIAEDFHDIGMTEYVEYWQDENGEDIPSEIGYSNMVAVLVKAIQELSAKNDALEARIETLEGA